MKLFLILASTIMSLNLFASSTILSVDGLKELSKSDVTNLHDALIIANNGNYRYGICNINWLTTNPDVRVYVDDNNVDPLIVALSDTEWLKFTSDQSMTQIVSATVGTYAWTRVNSGTLIKPDFQIVKTITTNLNCLTK